MAIGLKNTSLISITLLGGAYWYIVLISFSGKKEEKTGIVAEVPKHKRVV
jgi:hypothetical protein